MYIFDYHLNNNLKSMNNIHHYLDQNKMNMIYDNQYIIVLIEMLQQDKLEHIQPYNENKLDWMDNFQHINFHIQINQNCNHQHKLNFFDQFFRDCILDNTNYFLKISRIYILNNMLWMSIQYIQKDTIYKKNYHCRNQQDKIEHINYLI